VISDSGLPLAGNAHLAGTKYVATFSTMRETMDAV
jgi:hypothetical protein